MFTLDNFDSKISSTIVQRGRSYFADGLVSDLEEDPENVWSAEVFGSDNYQVEIRMNDSRELESFSCDCPYDGAICKHVVAVCYAIREERAKAANTKPSKPSAKQKKITFEALLDKISLEEYKNFVRTQAAQDKDFKTNVELFFADKDDRMDVEKKYGDLIRKLIRKHDHRGFLNYRATCDLSSDISGVIYKGSDMIAKGNFRDAFLLGKAALKELILIIGRCDDSSGSMGGTFYEATTLIGDIAKANDAAMDLKQQVFDFLKTELENGDYFSYGDFGNDLFTVFGDLAVQLRQTTEFVYFIDRRYETLTGKYDVYHKDFLRKEKIKHYQAIGQDNDAGKLIQQNIDIVEIRQGEVNKAIDRKDYAEAKRLVADGIIVAESKERPGTVTQWKKELLRIATLENDTETIRQLSRYFAFDRGFSHDHYRQWKQTYNDAEWKTVIEEYISKKIDEVTRIHREKKPSVWNYSPNPPLLQYLAPVYIEEQYWDRLLELVKVENHLDALLSYQEHLAKRYPREMLDLFTPALAQAGKKAGDRSAYASLAGTMQKLIMDFPDGKEEILAVARNLIALNPRRPAMIDELGKVLKA